jgi:hypothetical protein
VRPEQHADMFQRGWVARSRPLLSVIIPSVGRPGLPRTLASIRDQGHPDAVEIVVVGDTHAGTFRHALADMSGLCAFYYARYLEHDGGGHMVGHPQRQHGMAQARGEWLAFSQDDNVLTPGAIDAIRDALVGTPGPRLFRVSPRPGCVVWDQLGCLAVGHIDADCLVVPNVPARLGTWTSRYAGDADMIAETVARWGGTARWDTALIARQQL